MNLISIIKGILNVQKKIEVIYLPSQGLFYKDDFELYIKKAKIEDIIEYEYKYNKENLGSVITRLKKIVEKNVILSKNYTYNDIKSIDIVFLNYYEPELDLIEKYDTETKEFNFNGYKYSVPSIGIENSLTHFLVSKSDDPNSESYNTYSYDFLYFLGNKSTLSFQEIDNLIQIFNFDIPESDRKYIRKIVKKLSEIGRYSLKRDSQIIDVTAKIDLEEIWK